MLHNGPYTKIMEVNGAESDLNCRDPVQGISEKNFSTWPKDSSCDILAKNMTALCSCLKNLLEAKVKSFVLIAFAKEISK